MMLHGLDSSQRCLTRAVTRKEHAAEKSMLVKKVTVKCKVGCKDKVSCLVKQ